MVRGNTVRRDPIGTTAEALTRRSRQSLRAHILQNVEARTIDPQTLLGKKHKEKKSRSDKSKRHKIPLFRS